MKRIDCGARLFVRFLAFCLYPNKKTSRVLSNGEVLYCFAVSELTLQLPVLQIQKICCLFFCGKQLCL